MMHLVTWCFYDYVEYITDKSWLVYCCILLNCMKISLFKANIGNIVDKWTMVLPVDGFIAESHGRDFKLC